jgi:hypothetical protein
MASVISIDSRLVDLLPTHGRLKLGRLLRLARMSQDAFHSSISQQESLREQIGSINSERSNFIAREKAKSSDANAKEPNTAEYDIAIEHLQGELSRLEGKRAKLEAHRFDSQQLIAQLRSFLEQLPPGMTLARAQQLPASHLNGSRPDSAVAKIRAEITKVQNELHALATAPLPGGELREKARAYVIELAKAGRPQLMAERGEFRIDWPPGSQMAMGTVGPGAAAIIAAINPDGLYALIEEQINRISGAGLASSERPKREAQLRARIADLERQEESIIEKADGDDWNISRRPQASPWIVLGVRHSQVGNGAA